MDERPVEVEKVSGQVTENASEEVRKDIADQAGEATAGAAPAAAVVNEETVKTPEGAHNEIREEPAAATATHNDVRPENYFGGIEGGATKTNMVIINRDREVLAEGEVGPSNPWLLGFDRCADLLLELIEQTRAKAGNVALTAIGMSLSGAGQQSSRDQLRSALKAKGADVESIFIEEDIVAPVFAISNKGGVNMICGTGSNCVVFKKDGSSKKVGGWGHLLGDEAGAYWISQRATKLLFDHYDNYRPITSFNPDKVRDALLTYMGKTSMDDILDKYYKEFSKDFVAGFAKRLAQLASDGDELAQSVFRDAGYEIGRHILALQPEIDASLLENSDSLTVICTGGVFKGWKHLKPGITDALTAAASTKRNLRSLLIRWLSKGKDKRSEPLQHVNADIKQIAFIRLVTPAAIGAAVWAAGKVNVSIRDPDRTKVSKTIDVIYL